MNGPRILYNCTLPTHKPSHYVCGASYPASHMPACTMALAVMRPNRCYVDRTKEAHSSMYRLLPRRLKLRPAFCWGARRHTMAKACIHPLPPSAHRPDQAHAAASTTTPLPTPDTTACQKHCWDSSLCNALDPAYAPVSTAHPEALRLLLRAQKYTSRITFRSCSTAASAGTMHR